ncbi:MAG: D-alanyl-D-alanine carboxypeptidase [Proteobacteria bacterium]|nr:D-alanyl-D-alanine carboxypeptidase [Pseudomonadota bacterium]MDA1058614.1 D-alanyl-D-alanine carboxypeptidase [Pseudomonadota bacterium]
MLTRTLLLIAIVTAGAFSSGSILAQSIDSPAREAILLDAQTGAVLFEKNADEMMPPASMSKLMTLFMVFERLRDGSISLDDTMRVSEAAWRMGGSRMFVEHNSRVTVSDLLRGVIVQSGNDASVVFAEGLAGSEEAFAEEMTRRGREIGLTRSVFRNSTGWPDPDHRTTARDLSTLARHIIQVFPAYYEIFQEKEFTYNNIRQGNRNPLLYKDIGADGLKTGHTEESGYGLVASATRKGRRLILVINGLESVNQRSQESERLLDIGFREFNNFPMFLANEVVEDAQVWLGSEPTVSLVLEESLLLTMSRKARREMKVTVVYDSPIAAPIEKGARLAQLRVEGPNMEPVIRDLVAAVEVDRLGFVGRLGAAISHIVWGSQAP